MVSFLCSNQLEHSENGLLLSSHESNSSDCVSVLCRCAVHVRQSTGTVCGSGGNVRVATGKGVDRDSGNLVMATAAAGSDTGASGAVALKTGSTSAGSSGALSLTTGTAVSGSGAIPVFLQVDRLPITHHTL